MNFDEAIAAHREWTKRITDYLDHPDGTIDPDIISRDDVCVLGRWLYGEGKRIGYLTEMKELIEEHKKFHQTAAKIIRKGKTKGDVAQLVQGTSSEFQKSISHIVFLLNKLKNLCAF